MMEQSDQANPRGLETEHRADARERYVSPSRLAREIGVHINTIYRDIRKGALRVYRRPGSRQFRIKKADADRYLQMMRFPDEI